MWAGYLLSKPLSYSSKVGILGIVFSKSETHKHGSVLSLVYIRSGLIFIEKCQIFQCKTKCKQKIKLSCVCDFHLLKFQWLPLISPQPIMVERQTISHMNALLGGTKMLGEQLSSFLRGCHATSSLKSAFFTREVAWSSLIELHSCS